MDACTADLSDADRGIVLTVLCAHLCLWLGNDDGVMSQYSTFGRHRGRPSRQAASKNLKYRQYREMTPSPGTRKSCGIPGANRLNEASLNDWNRSPHSRYVSRAPDHFYRRADLHPGKKFSGKIYGHPHATIRCRIATKITPIN